MDEGGIQNQAEITDPLEGLRYLAVICYKDGSLELEADAFAAWELAGIVAWLHAQAGRMLKDEDE